MKTNAATNQTQKKYADNPTVTVAFENLKFGQGSYLSNTIDAQSFDTIQKHIQIGSRLLFKARKTSKGEPMFFVEVLPPRESNNSEI